MTEAADRDRFLEFLAATFGKEERIMKHQPKSGPAVYAFVFRDFPRAGRLTAVTYGLSLGRHESWVESRPEVLLSIDSTDLGWAFAAAYFSAEFRDKKPFCYGDVFTTDTPLAEDSPVEGLLVFAPEVIEPSTRLALSDRQVHFVQLYPFHQSELPIYREVGLEAFWKHPQFGMHDPKRAPIQPRSVICPIASRLRPDTGEALRETLREGRGKGTS